MEHNLTASFLRKSKILLHDKNLRSKKSSENVIFSKNGNISDGNYSQSCIKNNFSTSMKKSKFKKKNKILTFAPFRQCIRSNSKQSYAELLFSTDETSLPSSLCTKNNFSTNIKNSKFKKNIEVQTFPPQCTRAGRTRQCPRASSRLSYAELFSSDESNLSFDDNNSNDPNFTSVCCKKQRPIKKRELALRHKKPMKYNYFSSDDSDSSFMESNLKEKKQFKLDSEKSDLRKKKQIIKLDSNKSNSNFKEPNIRKKKGISTLDSDEPISPVLSSNNNLQEKEKLSKKITFDFNVKKTSVKVETTEGDKPSNLNLREVKSNTVSGNVQSLAGSLDSYSQKRMWKNYLRDRKPINYKFIGRPTLDKSRLRVKKPVQYNYFSSDESDNSMESDLREKKQMTQNNSDFDEFNISFKESNLPKKKRMSDSKSTNSFKKSNFYSNEFNINFKESNINKKERIIHNESDCDDFHNSLKDSNIRKKKQILHTESDSDNLISPVLSLNNELEEKDNFSKKIFDFNVEKMSEENNLPNLGEAKSNVSSGNIQSLTDSLDRSIDLQNVSCRLQICGTSVLLNVIEMKRLYKFREPVVVLTDCRQTES